MKNNLINFSILLLGLMVYIPVMAQPPGGPPPSNLPIDGGLGLVVAACVSYGAKRIYNKRQNNQ